MKSITNLVFAALVVASSSAIAGEKEVATKLVNEAAAAVESNRASAVAEIGKKDGRFTSGEVYVFAYELDGTMAAHPVNPKLVGKPLLDVPDAAGKMFRKEIIDGVKASGSATVGYKYKNPKSGEIEDKVTYCKKAASLAICAGYYN